MSWWPEPSINDNRDDGSGSLSRVSMADARCYELGPSIDFALLDMRLERFERPRPIEFEA